MAAMGYADWGGGPPTSTQGGRGHGTPVADLVADPDRPADVRETLTVHDDGRPRSPSTGRSPGPDAARRPAGRPRRGDRLVNDDVADGTTLHWHGVDVPNAADGVAGVTQDAVVPGEEFVYRFVAEQAGHVLVPLPPGLPRAGAAGPARRAGGRPGEPEPADVDEIVAPPPLRRPRARSTASRAPPTIDAEPGDDGPAPGRQHRQRPRDRVGAPGRRSACSPSTAPTSTQPGEVTDDAVAAARPAAGSTSASRSPRAGSGSTSRAAPVAGRRLRRRRAAADGPRRRRRPAVVRRARRPRLRRRGPRPALRLPHRPRARLPRRPTRACGGRINGQLFPDVPMYMVAEGDVVVFEIDNSSGDAHPMHLHGHHAVVLVPRRRAGHRQPVVGRLARGRGRARPTRSPFAGRQPRPLDGPLPQPAPRRGGAGRPPDVRRRHLVVPGRRRPGNQPE